MKSGTTLVRAVSVSLSTRVVSLIFAGWLPQDGWFGWSDATALSASVAITTEIVVTAHTAVVHPLPGAATTPTLSTRTIKGPARYSSTASDQHHPASSRAIAVLATTARLLRASNPDQRACRRRLPCSARPRAAGEASSWRLVSCAEVR